MNHAVVADDGLNDVLIMDWPTMPEPKSKKTEAASPIGREEVQRIISGQMATSRKEIVADVVTALKPKPPSIWNHPWIIGVGCAVIGGLAVYSVGAVNSHNAEDLKRDIAAEVNKQLDPIRQQIQRQGEDIAKIKGANGIAQSPLPKDSPFRAFATLDQAQLRGRLGQVATVAAEAQSRGILDSPDNVDTLQKRLAALPLDTPEASRAAASLINYATFVRGKLNTFPNIEKVLSSMCEAVHIEHPKFPPSTLLNGFQISGCKQVIDNGFIWKNGTFTHAVIVWNGNPFRLENVKFIDCVFIFSRPVEESAPAKQLAQTVLANNVGPNPNFTASAD